jgi:hypothetical protein
MPRDTLSALEFKTYITKINIERNHRRLPKWKKNNLKKTTL